MDPRGTSGGGGGGGEQVPPKHISGFSSVVVSNDAENVITMFYRLEKATIKEVSEKRLPNHNPKSDTIGNSNWWSDLTLCTVDYRIWILGPVLERADWTQKSLFTGPSWKSLASSTFAIFVALYIYLCRKRIAYSSDRFKAATHTPDILQEFFSDVDLVQELFYVILLKWGRFFLSCCLSEGVVLQFVRRGDLAVFPNVRDSVVRLVFTF